MKSLNFSLNVFRRNGRYIVEAPKFKVAREGKDLAALVKGMRDEIEDIFAATGCSDFEIPTDPAGINQESLSKKSESPFISELRFAISAAVILHISLLVGVAFRSGGLDKFLGVILPDAILNLF